MPLTRRPSISDARIGDRAAQTAISNTRQRIEQIEALVSTLETSLSQTDFSGSRSTLALNAMQAQINVLKAQIAALGTAGDGSVLQFTSDGTIAVGDVVYATSTLGVDVVDPLDPLKISAAIGVAASAATIGGPVTVRRFGHLLLSAFTFDVGRAIYANVGGGLTQAPSYAEVAIPVGVANTVNSIYVMPGWPSLMFDGFDPFYEDFLPVTQRRLREEIEQNVGNEILYVVSDTSLDSAVRLARVNAVAGDIVVTLPSGFIDNGNQTREVTVYRRDQGSGPLGVNVVSIVTIPGQDASGSYELELVDGDALHFLAIGAEGWILT